MDRNGVVLAQNYSAYTLELTPYKIEDLEQPPGGQLGRAGRHQRPRHQALQTSGRKRNFESIR